METILGESSVGMVGHYRWSQPIGNCTMPKTIKQTTMDPETRHLADIHCQNKAALIERAWMDTIRDTIPFRGISMKTTYLIEWRPTLFPSLSRNKA